MCERRKFGPIGWNRSYPFNPGDLSVCITVANNYLDSNPKVPWTDLRYIFGEIMYGGHITDNWDRRLCSSYLASYVKKELLDNLAFFPKFEVPPPTSSHKQYCEFIEERLATETPAAFGLHANSEINFMTQQANTLFASVAELQPRAGGSGAGGVSMQERVKLKLDEITDKLPDLFPYAELEERTQDERSPYTSVFLQECERMNLLLFEMKRSLGELDLGLKGDLSISEKMELLMNSLFDNRVPDAWAKLDRGFPPLRGLGSWLVDLLARQRQLEAWTADLATPKVTWLPGLFNPQAFLVSRSRSLHSPNLPLPLSSGLAPLASLPLPRSPCLAPLMSLGRPTEGRLRVLDSQTFPQTAVMQVTARKNEWPLDKLATVVDVSKKTAEEVQAGEGTRDGAFISGLFVEGARWDAQAGVLDDAIMKQLYCPLPLVLVKAATQDKGEARDIYPCPVYQTLDRGSTRAGPAGTYVFTAGLKTKAPPIKWVLAGVALIMDVEG